MNQKHSELRRGTRCLPLKLGEDLCFGVKRLSDVRVPEHWLNISEKAEQRNRACMYVWRKENSPSSISLLSFNGEKIISQRNNICWQWTTLLLLHIVAPLSQFPRRAHLHVNCSWKALFTSSSSSSSVISPNILETRKNKGRAGRKIVNEKSNEAVFFVLCSVQGKLHFAVMESLSWRCKIHSVMMFVLNGIWRAFGPRRLLKANTCAINDRVG